jgi:hypothetical protein
VTVTDSRKANVALQARRSLWRARRKLAAWAAPEVHDELRETRRKLKATRSQLRTARAELRDTQAQLTQAAIALPPEVEETIARVRAEHLTYLKPPNLRELAAIVRELEHDQVPGLVVEAGTALGGSAIVLAAAKAAERPMKVYDVFGMIPAPSEQDGADVHSRYEKIAGGDARGVGGETYYGYRDDLYSEVTESFRRLGVPVDERNVELVKGLFEDTIRLDEPVAFAHLDGDWYESTMTCLERIAPLVVPGGRIVLDDYYAWSGCRAAVDEYFEDRDGFRLEHRAKLHVVRD